MIYDSLNRYSDNASLIRTRKKRENKKKWKNVHDDDEDFNDVQRRKREQDTKEREGKKVHIYERCFFILHVYRP